MNFVRTVLGDVPTSDLGMVYSHEHLIISGGLGVKEKPDLRLDSIEKAVEEINDVKGFGVHTFVDMMPLDCGREPISLVEIAKQAKVNIIAATGFHKPMYYDDLHWIYHYNVDQIVDLLVAEIEVGMDRYSYNGPLVDRISARAGVIKGASDYNCMKKVTEKLFQAIAQAYLRTGAPISTHTEGGTFAMEQVELLLGEGVPADKIIIGHIDRNPDFAYHKALARQGVFLEYDNISRIKYWPDSVISGLIMKMVEAGYEDHILLGTDFALHSYWKAYGGGPGMAYLMKTFVPRLKQEGLKEETIYKFLVENPARAFSFKKVPLKGRGPSEEHFVSGKEDGE